jgi:hypothetical protein
MSRWKLEFFESKSLLVLITRLVYQVGLYTFITNCNWAYARWQCYINKEQYVNSNT